MKAGPILMTAIGVFAISASVHVAEQSPAAARTPAPERAWTQRTAWGDPDVQGEWTAEGEYGVPFERPAQFGTRQFLTESLVLALTGGTLGAGVAYSGIALLRAYGPADALPTGDASVGASSTAQ